MMGINGKYGQIWNDVIEQIAANWIIDITQILDSEENKMIEEKLAEIDTYMDERLQCFKKKDTDTEVGEGIREKFWDCGTLFQREEITLRKVCQEDKNNFYELQRETSITPHMFQKEDFQESLWQEHIVSPMLACTILKNDKYVGYCAIKDVTKAEWEISIELLECWHGKGIGYKALKIFLDMIKERIQVCTFRVRTESDNYISQRLFEKLGAVPAGISEFLLHDSEEIIRYEEKYLYLIDEKLIEVANKFQVEPRKLLSHVLEYKLEWH